MVFYPNCFYEIFSDMLIVNGKNIGELWVNKSKMFNLKLQLAKCLSKNKPRLKKHDADPFEVKQGGI